MIYAFSALIIFFGVALDQFTKYLASTYLKGAPITIIEGVFELHYLENRGAAFGMMQNQQLFFLITASIALAIITIVFIRLPKEKKYFPLRICLTCIATGALGNMIDRVRLQYVIDFFYAKFINFPIFNVADIFATVSTLVLAILFMFYYKDSDIDIIFQTLCFKHKKSQE